MSYFVVGFVDKKNKRVEVIGPCDSKKEALSIAEVWEERNNSLAYRVVEADEVKPKFLSVKDYLK